MKIKRNPLLILSVLCFAGCSEHDSESSVSTLSEARAKALMELHNRTPQSGVLGNFVDAISSSNYKAAFQNLPTKLRSAWTEERFAKDWTEIKRLVGDTWGPWVTDSFSGTAPQGAYQQATYALSSDWNATASVELVSMQTDEGSRIVKVHIRIPSAEPPQDHVQDLVGKFLDAMLSKNFDFASQCIHPSVNAQYSTQTLQQMSLILGGSTEATTRAHYRLCANTVWYDAIRVMPTEAPATFMELITSTENGETHIMALSFKGRLRK